MVSIFIERWSEEGWLTLRTAFSRDQPQKHYVQDVMMEDYELVWKLIEVLLKYVDTLPLPLCRATCSFYPISLDVCICINVYNV